MRARVGWGRLGWAGRRSNKGARRWRPAAASHRASNLQVGHARLELRPGGALCLAARVGALAGVALLAGGVLGRAALGRALGRRRRERGRRGGEGGALALLKLLLALLLEAVLGWGVPGTNEGRGGRRCWSRWLGAGRRAGGRPAALVGGGRIPGLPPPPHLQGLWHQLIEAPRADTPCAAGVGPRRVGLELAARRACERAAVDARGGGERVWLQRLPPPCCRAARRGSPMPARPLHHHYHYPPPPPPHPG
jgi:hypothetical protein